MTIMAIFKDFMEHADLFYGLKITLVYAASDRQAAKRGRFARSGSGAGLCAN
jgi:hypothetical protein